MGQCGLKSTLVSVFYHTKIRICADVPLRNHLTTTFPFAGVAAVLSEMISVRDGAFCLHQFDDDLVKSLIECICTNR